MECNCVYLLINIARLDDCLFSHREKKRNIDSLFTLNEDT